MQLNVISNIKGNSKFEITSEVAEVFNGYYGGNFFPETNPNYKYYDAYNPYPYPFKINLLEVITKLQELKLFKDEKRYQKAPKDIQRIVDQVKSFVFQKTQIWQNSIPEEVNYELPSDCFFSYLISAHLSDSLVFLEEDSFGKNANVPVKIIDISYQPASLFMPPSVGISFNTYHYYSKEEYYRVENDISIPIGDMVNLTQPPFVRDLSKVQQILNERHKKLTNLVGSACQSFNAENPNKTPFNLIRFMGRLVPEMALNERYLFNPVVTETHFEVYDDLSRNTYLVNHEDEPIENWYYSRTISAFSVKRLQGRLVNLDWVIETPYDKERINTLILPEKSKKELLAMCSSTKAGSSYADPFRGNTAKIVLLEGVPGTGKTSSIMGISDYLEMPLIHLSIAALGYYSEIGYTLARILQLAESFGAFVLIDEADILLKARSIDNLQHNNIVTAVLKELESFNGLLFLTSNLDFDKVDSAVRSRLKHRISFEYPDTSTLRKVWDLNLKNINFSVSDEKLDELANISAELRIDLRKVVNICSLVYDLKTYDTEMAIDVLSYVKEA